jgi:hypothetical protein
VAQRVRYNIPKRGILRDDDGSLTGQSPSGSATYAYQHLNMPGCTENQEIYNGYVCDSTVTLHRILFHNSNPLDDFKNMDMRVLRVEAGMTGNYSDVPISKYSTIQFREKSNPKMHWVMVVAMGQKYKVHWANGIDWDGFSFTKGEPWGVNDGSVHIQNNYSEFRETFSIKVGDVVTAN